jgi:hypothetical protein
MASWAWAEEPPSAAGLFGILQELGGWYEAFARFLCWRADLLHADDVTTFRLAPDYAPPIGRADFVNLIRAELGSTGDQVAERLDPEPCWSTLARCAYRSEFKGRSVVIQAARRPFSALEFREFERGLRKHRGFSRTQAGSGVILRQFFEWTRLSEDPSRERSYLEALQDASGKTSCRYPQVVPEISSGPILSWLWPEGEPVKVRIAAGDRRIASQLAELVLEQTCLLGMIDADLDLESIVTTGDGRLALLRCNRMISLPPALRLSTLRYLSAVMSANFPIAARMLLRLAQGRATSNLEAALLKELSQVEPELKGWRRFPGSAMVFEGNWRAISRVVSRRPLHLDFLHRNLNAVGYWAAETVVSGPESDCIVEAQFAVLGRMLRRRMSSLLTGEAAGEWMAGSLMLFMETVRQMGRTAEDLRDNDLSLGMEIAGMKIESESRNRLTRAALSACVLLVTFLLSMRWGVRAPAPWSAVLGGIATAAFGALVWVVARID